ncbi:MAG: hypothetical protein WCE81_00570 [Halobacteriota archaeon]
MRCTITSPAENTPTSSIGPKQKNFGVQARRLSTISNVPASVSFVSGHKLLWTMWMAKLCQNMLGVISGAQLPVLLGNGVHLTAFDVKD